MNDDGDSYIFKMDNDGQLLYYYRGFYNKSGSVMNFQKHELDGVVTYSFFEPSADISDHLLYMGVQYGHINLLDDQYQLIQQMIRLLLKTTKSIVLINNNKVHKLR